MGSIPEKLETLEEVVSYFEEDPDRRAVQFPIESDGEVAVGECQYLTPCGKRCALGMLLSVEAAKEMEEKHPGPIRLYIEDHGSIQEVDALLKKFGEYRLRALQEWHDLNKIGLGAPKWT